MGGADTDLRNASRGMSMQGTWRKGSYILAGLL
jgi:hypothetical protein